MNLLRRAFLSTVIISCVTIAASAKIIALSPVKMLVNADDRVQIKGFRGELTYIVIDSAKDMTIEVKENVSEKELPTQEDWQFSFRREGSTLQIFVEGPSSKDAWSKILAQGEIPSFDIKVTGPSLPVDINWNEGNISIANLKNNLQITSLKSHVIVLKSHGGVQVTNHEGSIGVRNIVGEVKVDSYSARVSLENIEGKVDLENFIGESTVKNINGNMNISSYKGNTKIYDIKGRLEFKNGNSPLHIDKFEGELRGKTLQGPIFADIRGDADVRLESVEGAVNLKLPSSGAWVNLGTEEGSLLVPNFLKLTRMQTKQIRTGRLRGSSGGSVFVRTTTGDIRLR